MQHVPSGSRAVERGGFVRGPRLSLDHLGVVASCLCAVHCAVGTFIVSATGLAGYLFRDERLELIFLIAAVSLAIVSVMTGYRQHHNRGVAALAASGLFLLGAARAIPGPQLLEAAASVVGASLLVAGHILNAQLLHRLGMCCSGDAGSSLLAREPPVEGR